MYDEKIKKWNCDPQKNMNTTRALGIFGTIFEEKSRLKPEKINIRFTSYNQIPLFSPY